jgi:hypothetical protein
MEMVKGVELRQDVFGRSCFSQVGKHLGYGTGIGIEAGEGIDHQMEA